MQASPGLGYLRHQQLPLIKWLPASHLLTLTLMWQQCDKCIQCNITKCSQIDSLICFNSPIPCSISAANSEFEDRIYQLFTWNLPASQLAGSQGESWEDQSSQSSPSLQHSINSKGIPTTPSRTIFKLQESGSEKLTLKNYSFLIHPL